MWMGKRGIVLAIDWETRSVENFGHSTICEILKRSEVRLSS
jgi:hypothetical protein